MADIQRNGIRIWDGEPTTDWNDIQRAAVARVVVKRITRWLLDSPANKISIAGYNIWWE